MLSLFIPTFFIVSVTPGMCMTLSMTLGMTIGVKRALWMMAGELVGVSIVVVLSMVGVATMMLSYPSVFTLFKLAGGIYLIYLGVELWRSKGRLAIPENNDMVVEVSRRELAFQGFVTAIANPKGWAFFIALLPPFIDQSLPLLPQLALLIGIILIIEFICLVLYAVGGQSLAHLLRKRSNVRLMNRLAGSLMLGVGVWLAVS